ncbi:MAG: hypothetical protein D6754_08740 [Alphaproteobacteria bacterium]|nr:MAG: hypothetical protein D6754_08740 [Alphaproteobacteria bacterium]
MIAGLVVAGLGIAGLLWCVAEARRIRAGGMDADTQRRRLSRLVGINLLAVTTGFIGAAIVVLALILK